MTPKDSNPTEAVAARLAGWVGAYPAKELARRFEVEPRTVKSWRAGNLPQMRHLLMMVAEWGTAFVEHVLAPVLDESDMDVSRRVERIRQDLAVVERLSREAAHGRQHGAPMGADRGAAARAAGGAAGAAVAQAGRAGAQALSRAGRRAAGLLAPVAVALSLLAAAPDQAQARPARTARPPVSRVQQQTARTAAGRRE